MQQIYHDFKCSLVAHFVDEYLYCHLSVMPFLFIVLIFGLNFLMTNLVYAVYYLEVGCVCIPVFTTVVLNCVCVYLHVLPVFTMVILNCMCACMCVHPYAYVCVIEDYACIFLLYSYFYNGRP